MDLRWQATLNKFAWSTVASVIYLDSPAGVGLSYSETRSDYVTNDTHTAADADAFLRHFFRRFPEFRRNDLYIAGVGLPASALVTTCALVTSLQMLAGSNDCNVICLCEPPPVTACGGCAPCLCQRCVAAETC